MRLALPSFVLRRLGHMRPRPGERRPNERPDPADMGTEFGLDASIVGWSDSLLGRDADTPAAPAGGVHAEPPLKWLDASAPRRR